LRHDIVPENYLDNVYNLLLQVIMGFFLITFLVGFLRGESASGLRLGIFYLKRKNRLLVDLGSYSVFGVIADESDDL
jgi:hypothetical protein